MHKTSMLVSLFSLWRRDSEGERIVITSIVYLPHPHTLSGSLPSHVLNILESPHRPVSQLLLSNDHNSVLKPGPGNTDITDTSDVFLFMASVIRCAMEGSVTPSKPEMNFSNKELTHEMHVNLLQYCL